MLESETQREYLHRQIRERLVRLDSSVHAASDIVLILGALSTVLAAFGAFFSPDQSWHLNAEIYGRLRALEAQLEFTERDRKFVDGEDAIVATFFDEYQSILADYNRKWQQLRQKSK